MRLALKYGLPGLILALCASVSMGVTFDQYQAQKRAAIERALAQLNVAGAQSGLILAGISDAAALVSLSGTPASNEIVLELSRAVTPKCFVAEDGRKFVADLPDTIAIAPVDETLAAALPAVASIRFSQFTVDPAFTTRVVIEFAEAIQYESANGVLRLQKKSDLTPLLTVSFGDFNVPSEPDMSLDHLAKVLENSAGNGAEGRPLHTKMQDLEERLSATIELPKAPENADVRSVRPFTLKVEKIENVLQALQADDVETTDAEPVEEPAAPEEEAAPAEPAPPGPRTEAPAIADTGEVNKQVAVQRQELLEKLESGNDDLSKMGISEGGGGDKPARKFTGDPMSQIVSIDFREMPLTNAVAILAHKGDINVIAGSDLEGLVVTTQLKNVPLRQAMATALRIHKLGFVEEEGIFYIRPYEEAVAADRFTKLVNLEHAKPGDVKTVMDELLEGSNFEDRVTVSAHEQGDIVVISGPEAKVHEAAQIVASLDVERRTLPTITEAISLNFATPTNILPSISALSTPEVGQVSGDERSRTIIVTDIPIVVDQIRVLVAELDRPVRQVAIDSMIVDVVLGDAAETGVDWLLQAVKRQSRRDAAAGNNVNVGNLQNLGLNTQLGIADTAAGILDFGILTGDLDWRGIIQAEVRNNDSRLISNPRMVTLENEEARLAIAQEIPYVELTSTEAGGQQTSTEFKDIGTQLTVTPRVTHDNQILVKVDAKESFANGVFNGIPVEDKREVVTNALMKDGETIWLGGLRKNSNTASVRKIPVLGDIPVVNFMFRQNVRNEDVNELLIFLTCSVVEGTSYLNDRELGLRDAAELKTSEPTVDAQRSLFVDMAHPEEMRDPIWRWRKPQE